MITKIEQLTKLLAQAEKDKARLNGSNQSGIDNAGACFLERRKYFLIDHILTNTQHCGLWMVDKETGFVYTIRAYGQKGVMVSEIDQMIEVYSNSLLRTANHNSLAFSKAISIQPKELSQ